MAGADAPVKVDIGDEGFIEKIKVTDADDAEVLLTVDAERSADNSYVAILKYDQLATLPLTITVEGYKDTSDSATDADTAMDAVGMVGMGTEPPVVDPDNTAPVFTVTAPITISGTVGTAITTVDVSATDADAGDVLTYSWDITSANEAATRHSVEFSDWDDNWNAAEST